LGIQIWQKSSAQAATAKAQALGRFRASHPWLFMPRPTMSYVPQRTYVPVPQRAPVVVAPKCPWVQPLIIG
jgi:hypothetical protein